jgi:hypothetical protein
VQETVLDDMREKVAENMVSLFGKGGKGQRSYASFIGLNASKARTVN